MAASTGILHLGFILHLELMTRRVLGSMQFTLQSVFPMSLQMEMEKRPKLARTRLMTVPASHWISRVVPSQPYFVRLSKLRPLTDDVSEVVVRVRRKSIMTRPFLIRSGKDGDNDETTPSFTLIMSLLLSLALISGFLLQSECSNLNDHFLIFLLCQRMFTSQR